MTSEELDEAFDNNEDVSEFFDFTKVTQPGLEIKRVNVDMPVWMMNSLETESKKLGITRQALIKVWLAEKLNWNNFFELPRASSDFLTDRDQPPIQDRESF